MPIYIVKRLVFMIRREEVKFFKLTVASLLLTPWPCWFQKFVWRNAVGEKSTLSTNNLFSTFPLFHILYGIFSTSGRARICKKNKNVTFLQLESWILFQAILCQRFRNSYLLLSCNLLSILQNKLNIITYKRIMYYLS